MSQASATEIVQRAPPKVHTLVHFEIPASDPAKLSSFYEEIFGWKFNKMETSAGMDYWLISHKDAQTPQDTMGGLYKRNMGEEQFLNYFLVNSIDDSVSKATNLGAKVVTAKQEIPQMGYFAILTDPDGNKFALFQGTPRM